MSATTYSLLNALHSISREFLSNQIPASFDVISMYTNIPINEAIQIALDYLQQVKPYCFGLKVCDIREFLEFILSNNVFQFNNVIYKQHRGLAMGSRIAPCLAILTMDYIERKSLYADNSISFALYKPFFDDSLLQQQQILYRS